MNRLLYVLLPLTLAACATTQPVAPDPIRSANGLSARSLGTGECGLFVWTAEAQRRFVLFAQSQTQQAVWDGPDGEVSLKIISQSGSETDGQYPKQAYDQSGLSLDLRAAQSIANGTRYKGGTLTQTSDGAWERITPVVGLSTCQT